MSRDRFESSDSVRSGEELPHSRVVRLEDALALERGGALEGVEVAYETYGTLDAAASNAVLVCHAISGDSHVARHGPADAPGWWEAMVGPGRPIDTERYLVICANVLGGCRGSTGPRSIDPATGRPYGRAFPEITVGDMVECQARLCDALGIERLHAVLGGSLGGHQALGWAVRHPGRVRHVIPIASSARLSSQAIAFDVIGRNALDGARDPELGLALARMLGHVTYLSRDAMARKFDAAPLERRTSRPDFEHRFAVGAYLAYQGERFVERFDPESYRALSLAMDRFSLGSTPAEIARSLSRAGGRWLVVSFTSDWLFPAEQSRELVSALLRSAAEVSYVNVGSDAGHDAFLLGEDVEGYGDHLRALLGEPRRCPPAGLEARALAEQAARGSRVLAVGADPPLLGALSARAPSLLRATVEHPDQVLACLRAGHHAVQAVPGELGELLPRDGFDLVVAPDALSRAPDLEACVAELLQLAPRVALGFENAAHDAHRQRLAKRGRLAESWHRGPPRRGLSIEDLHDWAHARRLRVEGTLAFDRPAGRQIHDDPNRLADRAFVVLARPAAAI